MISKAEATLRLISSYQSSITMNKVNMDKCFTISRILQLELDCHVQNNRDSWLIEEQDDEFIYNK